MRKRVLYLAIFILLLCLSGVTYAAPATITPGTEWYDTSSNPIAAQGAGVIKVGDTYYLIGMYTDNDPNNWLEVSGGHGCPLFVGITCYSSTDFANWTFENMLLTEQPSGDLGHYRWVGRPKVIYNDTTEQYVMYMNIDDPCVLLTQREGKVGVATCSTVNGNYTYLGSFNPLGDTVFDMTLFKDDDGKAYLITAGVNIYELTSDYLGVSSQTTRVRDGGEAPAMFKTGGVYYLLLSGSTWWTSNDNYYYTTTSLGAKQWGKTADFTPNSPDTCNSQTTYVQPIQGSSTTTFVYLGDRWDEWNFGDSTYIWQPLTLNGTTLTMDCYDEWTIDTATGEWGVPPCTVVDMHVQSIVCSTVGGTQGMDYGQATVTINDNCGDPVANALVDGTFSGDFSETFYDVATDPNGDAVFVTTSQARRPSFTFCVDDVSHATLSYDPNDNIETCDSY
ncbi:MAG: family 43 glycosylhydrolase [Planctomycetota bacterium]|nr:MAG: family 43 glycosylhydrolase [Planctomycetota bacterium]